MHRSTLLIALFLTGGLAKGTHAESKAEFSLEQNQKANWFEQDRTYQQTVEGVIDDSSSGLRWQHQAPLRQLSWSEAKKYCRSLALGDELKWRLPTRLELLSLLNYDKIENAYDSPYFDDEPPVAFWSGTVYDNMPSHVWIAQFGEGDMYCLMRVAQAHVRCVA